MHFNSQQENLNELIFNGKIYPGKTNYQLKLEKSIYPSSIYLKFFDNKGKELNSMKANVRFGIIYSVSLLGLVILQKNGTLYKKGLDKEIHS